MKRSVGLLLLLLPFLIVTGCSDPAPVSDAALPDAGPATPDSQPPALDGPPPEAMWPLSNVYKVNPVENGKKTTEVLLHNLTDKTGLLRGKFADVWNCVNELGGPKINLNLGGFPISGSICKLTQKARPGADGTYLQITPPAQDTDGGDSFAEVMMYHHIDTMGTRYRDLFGLAHVEKPLRAMVNVQGYADLFSNWVGVPNAAYFPKETADALKQLLGVDLLNGEEAIVFGYNNLVPNMPHVDFSYDASVIYHEYTHFTVGLSRLHQPSADQYGLDPTPFALHEALADYLPASYLDNPKVGTYALGSYSRDLTRSFKCPDHVVGEEHNDGEIASGAFWAARTVVGDKVLDQAIWKSVLTFTASTTFEQAATAILGEVKLAAPDKETAVKQIFTDHGMLGCVRLVEHKDFEVDPLFTTAKPRVAGNAQAGASYPEGVPGPLQYRVALAEGTKEVTIEYAAQTEGLMGLPIGGGAAELWVALRKGSSPITWKYDAGQGTSDAHKVLKGTVANNAQTLVLTGTCVSKGDLVFQFLNRAAIGAELLKVKVTQSTTPTQTTPNFDGC